jgi:hypothetical protein
MNKIFLEWKIVPLYIFLVMLGSFVYYSHLTQIQIFGWIFLVLIYIWAFWGIGLNHITPKTKKFESKINNFSLLFLPIVTSIAYTNFNQEITLANFFVSSLVSFLISLSFAFLIIANHELVTTGKNDFERSRVLLNLVVVGVIIIILFFRDWILINLPKLLGQITSDISIFITIALTFVLLCATLSLLAFTYILTIDIDKKKKTMQKNGEYFFSSTILSIVTLILIFLISIYLKSTSLFINFNIILTPNEYLNASLFVSLVIISILTFFYSFVYIIKGIYSSSKVLNIKWNAD